MKDFQNEEKEWNEKIQKLKEQREQRLLEIRKVTENNSIKQEEYQRLRVKATSLRKEINIRRKDLNGAED